ncbi:MAG: hypothetical protein JKY54_07210 [Flavobacteriales bacterium]|nr:hypothetical protein [Flavobacteriales bacterium]
MEDIEETSRRRNGGKVFHKAYNQHTIHLLKKLIFRVYNQGLRKFYCILVDGEMVVRRTSDARKFDGHKAYVDHTTEQVEVRLFIGKSFNANRYIFQTQTELSGTPQDVDVDLEISKALEAQKLQMELESLQRQVEKKDKKVRKLKSELEDRKSGLEDLSDLASKAVEIAGMFKGAGQKTVAGVPAPSAQVEVEIEEEDDFSEEREIFQELSATVGKKGLKKALEIMTLLSEHPELNDTLKEALNQKKRNHEQA